MLSETNAKLKLSDWRLSLTKWEKESLALFLKTKIGIQARGLAWKYSSLTILMRVSDEVLKVCNNDASTTSIWGEITSKMSTWFRNFRFKKFLSRRTRFEASQWVRRKTPKCLRISCELLRNLLWAPWELLTSSLGTSCDLLRNFLWVP